ncbi:hypothetical protein [Brucella sp. NBRC 12950]|uniref:hypothetical protein n=1 Tax=Brucella sp. NBRC 12950 TaxID=2994518 RepID=UPI0024A42300|nr:hypothetical protein [Brucella sp. NBRC 12950]GLU28249.1 hypothetical protein Brsp01_34820 [Brucella sp. NBRC 12950]
MKLIGSAIEEQYKKELEEGARFLFEERGNSRLLEVLYREIGSVESAYFLSGYKLSDYHICSLLVNGTNVCQVELSDDQIDNFYKISIPEYKKRLNKRLQIKLQVAIELAALK